MQTVIEDTAAYERWLRTQCDVVESGLRKKHDLMASDPFKFLRATFFRWSRTAPAFAGHLADAPLVLGVGDAHVENFGTWVDAEGRRVWGVNDFDEAARMPYPLDLIRLLTSAWLARELDVGRGAAARAVLAGYRQGLASPRPVLVEHGNGWFRRLLSGLDTTADSYWDEYLDYKPAHLPVTLQTAFKRALPFGATGVRFVQRQKGGGSLGRPRFYAIAHWRGGTVAREAKAIVPSAWDWASGAVIAPCGLELVNGAYRASDASIVRAGSFVIRRVTPDTRKLELRDVAALKRGAALLRAMAADLAAIHVSTASARTLAKHLDQLPQGWLVGAATEAEHQLRSDFRAWRHHHAATERGVA